MNKLTLAQLSYANAIIFRDDIIKKLPQYLNDQGCNDSKTFAYMLAMSDSFRERGIFGLWLEWYGYKQQTPESIALDNFIYNECKKFSF